MTELQLAYQRSDDFFTSQGNLAIDQAFALLEDPSLLSRLGAAVSMQEALKESDAAAAAIRTAQERARRNWTLALRARKASSWL